MPDYHEGLKLGRLPPRHDPRTLQLARYFLADLPPPPDNAQLPPIAGPWGMYGNDRLGDCTTAAVAHSIIAASTVAGKEKHPTEHSIESIYFTIGRQENPGQQNPDNGLVELDVLRYWRKHRIDGDEIVAFAQLDPQNHEHVKQAFALFGNLYLGIALPVTAQQQTGGGRVWDFVQADGPGEPWSWGGHAVNTIAYDTSGLGVITWGDGQRMTWPFWDHYVEECWAIIPAEYRHHGPAGFDLATMLADIAAISAGPVQAPAVEAPKPHTARRRRQESEAPEPPAPKGGPLKPYGTVV